MRTRRSWWLVYGGCAVVVIAAMIGVTEMVLRLEQTSIISRAHGDRQEGLRLALWRMDSWLAPLLAREAARPYFEYQAFYPQERAYTRRLAPIRKGEILAPSPLLSFHSDYFELHFQYAPDGGISSPQVPLGDFRKLAQESYLTEDQMTSNLSVLTELNETVGIEKIEQCVSLAETQQADLEINPDVTAAMNSYGTDFNDPPQVLQQARNWQELTKRRGAAQTIAKPQSSMPQQTLGAQPAPGGVTIGPFVGFWSDEDALVFTRSVELEGQVYFQGFVCNWQRLEQALLAEISDIFEGPTLVPVRGEPADDTATTMLATIPARLDYATASTMPLLGFTVPRSTLLLAWFVVLAGIGAVAVTLRASIAFGEKRARFASAVTHELRTPLTTFRMYSEMLAEGMVQDPEQRRVYLETLRDESGRLSALVENVLAYARLEEGRRPSQPRDMTVGSLLEIVTPPLRQRAEAAGVIFDVDCGVIDDTIVCVDPDAVGQVLYNLVDNACKYAGETGPIHLSAARTDGVIEVEVRDHGPGIRLEHARKIFDPFERGQRDPTDPVPGVGLGLALARGLARDLGGDLAYVASGQGACFRLSLPVAQPAG